MTWDRNWSVPAGVIWRNTEELGRANVGPFCYMVGPIEVGERTRISSHVVIGTAGEHKTRKPEGMIRIGRDVVIREFSIVHRGTGDRDTTIGDRCWLMDHSHVAHDVILGDDVTLSPNVTLGGHTRVHQGATIGIGAMTHQHTTIGAYAMVGMGAVVTRDVPPFALVVGNPARFQRWNTHAIERLGITLAEVERMAGDHASRAHGFSQAFVKDSRREWIRGPWETEPSLDPLPVDPPGDRRLGE